MEPEFRSRKRPHAQKRLLFATSAWLLVHLLRHLGLAARFVSGYLIQLTRTLNRFDGPSGTEKDFTDLHAWTESICRAPAGSGLIRLSGCSPGKGTSARLRWRSGVGSARHGSLSFKY